ncbi:hypothetical protein dqs_1714 [Azoarcus olearius]|uniref:NRDE family protein n=1 Tax=Azoarcus sp. (strain BH72) TaxID=418699 RepID=UPI0008060B63|nr:NRDE family protein [Azoarcus olearius]ANQ84758.1 hypothetical protein dqs_1714 [Azoarcus olearius]
MCLILFGWQARADFPLVVAANRDEFHDRPAAAAHWWADRPGLLAGRDLEAGGTWMGVSRRGRFAALTNYRDPARRRPGAPSRGMLVRDALESDRPALDVLHEIGARSADYVPFNLLVGDGNTLGILESTTGAVQELPPGIYGLSNHLLDSDWPKVKRARAAFGAALATLPDEGAFLALLRDTTVADDADLPATGVGLEWERWLSPAFVQAPGYGTRCSTLLTVDASGEHCLTEWSWNAAGESGASVTHRFRPSVC